MELLLLCAGAGDKTWTGSASDRPLRSKGKRGAQRTGAYLGREGLRPDVVLTASNKRSRVSAEKALKAAGWTARGFQYSEELSAGNLPDLPDVQRLLLAAPSATIKRLADQLGLELEAGPGDLFVLSAGNSGASLETHVHPRDLPDLFPYPAPDGPEQRERPAYYYTQSAAIPFRRSGGSTEILIVGSSSGRHWVVPKGIVEPGLSPAASAQTEAREEAGVEGRIGDEPLGRFSYQKWGAACAVEVFAMEVTRVLPNDAWDEKHRQRRWVSPSDAASLLHQPAFRDLVVRI